VWRVPAAGVVDGPVSTCPRTQRDKKRATPRQIQHLNTNNNRHSSKNSGRSQSRISAAAPCPALHGITGNRSQGCAPEASINGTGHGNTRQLVHSSCRHRRVRRAVLGRGFHRHVYASPTLLYGDWGPPSIPNTLPLNPT